MPRLDLVSLRYLASAASILVGVALLLYIALHGGGKHPEAAAVVEPTATTQAAAALEAIPIPTVQPTLQPAAPALVKGTEADCFRGWRFVDNPQQRWTVCLPINLLYFNGKDVAPFENLQPVDLPAVYRDFNAVNEAWYLAQAGSATVDALAPISLKIEVIAPTTALDGCPIRQQPPGPNGTVTCTDRLNFGPTGQPQYTSDGSYQRFRALTPTQPDKKTTDAFSLALTVYSYSSNSALQQRLFGLILDSLKPY